MKNNTENKLTRDKICLIVYSAIWAICALIYWIIRPGAGEIIYNIAVIWFGMPMLTLLACYILTIGGKPRGWKKFIPFISGGMMALLECVTVLLNDVISGEFEPPFLELIILVTYGMIVALVGLFLAKQDRKIDEYDRQREAKRLAENGGKGRELSILEQTKLEDAELFSENDELDFENVNESLGAAAVSASHGASKDDDNNFDTCDDMEDVHKESEREDDLLEETKDEAAAEECDGADNVLQEGTSETAKGELEEDVDSEEGFSEKNDAFNC